MSEGIFSLVGVVLGVVLTFFSTCIVDWRNRRYKKRCEEKKLICNVIKQYEILKDKIWFNTYYQDDPADILEYISNDFMSMRRSNREKELLFIRKELLNSIDQTDNLIFSFDITYNANQLMKIKNALKECTEILKKFAVK